MTWNEKRRLQRFDITCPVCNKTRKVCRSKFFEIRNGSRPNICRSCSNPTRLQKIKDAMNTPETRKNLREAYVNWVERTGIYSIPRYSPNSAQFVEEFLNGYAELGIQWRFKHSKEEFKWRGYFADAYCPEYNVWFEYDEPYHYVDGTLRAKDVERMNEIISTLGCSFWRFNEKTNELRRYN